MLTTNFDKLKQAGKEFEQELASILRRIGATPGEYSVEAVDIDISGEELWELAKSRPGARIILNGKSCLAYIKDHTYWRKDTYQRAIQEHEKNWFVLGNKVHFYYCQTLTQMEARGRSKRYRGTDANPDGRGNYLKIDLRYANDVETKLAWCQHCIGILPGTPEVKQLLDVRGLMRWRKYIAEHSDANVLMKCVDLLECARLGDWYANQSESPESPSGYPKDWEKISAAFRERCKYKCAVCGVDCSAYPRLIDAHHVNGVKSECRDENLRCLCKCCHAKQPFHSHYKVKLDDKMLLWKLRSKQGLKS